MQPLRNWLHKAPPSLANFLIKPGTVCLGMVLPTVAWALLHQSKRLNIPQLCPEVHPIQKTPQMRLSSQIALDCVKLTIKAN